MKVTIEFEHQPKGWKAKFREMPQYSACGPTQREAAQRLVTLVLEVLQQGNTQSTWLCIQNQLEVFGPPPGAPEQPSATPPGKPAHQTTWPSGRSI